MNLFFRETAFIQQSFVLILLNEYVIIISSHGSIYAAVVSGRPAVLSFRRFLFEAIIRKWQKLNTGGIFMENRLRNYFPLIRERKEVLKEIGESNGLQALFQSWTPERQEEFLDFCTGMKGVKILYDSFF